LASSYIAAFSSAAKQSKQILGASPLKEFMQQKHWRFIRNWTQTVLIPRERAEKA